MQFPVIVGLHRSSFLARALGLLALASSVFVLFYPRSPWLLCGLLVLIWLIAGLAWRRLHPPYSALRLMRDGQIDGRLPGATDFQPLHCLPGPLVHPWLTVLRLKPAAGGPVQTLVMLEDSASAEDFRRLRVFLRWQAMRFKLSGDAA